MERRTGPGRGGPGGRALAHLPRPPVRLRGRLASAAGEGRSRRPRRPGAGRLGAWMPAAPACSRLCPRRGAAGARVAAAPRLGGAVRARRSVGAGYFLFALQRKGGRRRHPVSAAAAAGVQSPPAKDGGWFNLRGPGRERGWWRSCGGAAAGCAERTGRSGSRKGERRASAASSPL